MTQKCSVARGVALFALVCACGSDTRPASPPESGEPATVVSSLSPRAAASSAPENSSPLADEGSCPTGECPDIMLFGTLVPGCCRGLDACGGQVQLAENRWLCAPPNADQNALALRDTLAAHAGEPFVPDPSCPSQKINDSTLEGCCITGGTCGVSSEVWTSAAAAFGLNLSSVCILASEAAPLAGMPGVDAGPAAACASPDAGLERH